MKQFYGNNDNARVNATLVNKRHSEENLSAVYVLELIAEFYSTGPVGNKKRVHERNKGREVVVLGYVAIDFPSTMKLSKVSSVPRTTIWRVLKYNFHSFKVRLVYEQKKDNQ